MKPSKQQVLEALAGLREGKLSFDDFRGEFSRLINGGILGGLQSLERSRVSEFTNYFDAYDPNVPPARSFRARWKMTSKRLNGEPGYPKEQIIKEALALEQCLLGNETRWQRVRRFFSVR